MSKKGKPTAAQAAIKMISDTNSLVARHQYLESEMIAQQKEKEKIEEDRKETMTQMRANKQAIRNK